MIERGDRPRAAHASPACRTGWSGSRRSTASPTSTTARRPTPTATAPALAAFDRGPLDRRRARQGRRSRRLPPALRPCRARLHDRRGGADVRRACSTADVPVEEAGTLDAAVAQRRRARARRATPCCCRRPAASFDQFRDYEDRGRRVPALRGGAGMTDARARDDRPRAVAPRLKRRGGRGDRSPLGTWFWDIDRVLLLLTLFADRDRADRGRRGEPGDRGALFGRAPSRSRRCIISGGR